MVLYAQDHSADQCSPCAIYGGSPSVDGNTSLMVEWNDSSFYCGPKLKQCRWEMKSLRPFWEGGLDVFFDCVHRKEMQQIALCTLPFIGKLYNEVQYSITYVTMVELKTYKIGDVDTSAIFCQKQGSCCRCMTGLSDCFRGTATACVSANWACKMQKTVRWRLLAKALSQRSADTKLHSRGQRMLSGSKGIRTPGLPGITGPGIS